MFQGSRRRGHSEGLKQIVVKSTHSNMYTLLKPIILYFIYFLQSLTPSNQFVEGVVGQPRSFFPNQTITENDKTISKLIYRGLFKYDNYGVLVLDLAENWSVSNDGLVYRMKIKSNQFWSDGK